MKLRQDFAVDWDNRLQSSRSRGIPGGELPQQHERNRPKQDRAGVDAKFLRLDKFIDRFGRMKVKGHAFFKLGDDKMVVRVKPLGHLHGGSVLSSSRHSEIVVHT